MCIKSIILTQRFLFCEIKLAYILICNYLNTYLCLWNNIRRFNKSKISTYCFASKYWWQDKEIKKLNENQLLLNIKSFRYGIWTDNDDKIVHININVGVRHILRGGNRVGIYFLETGAVARPSKVVYNRSGSSIAEIIPRMID